DGGHVVQFYEDDEALCDTVARFLEEGLEAGDRIVVVATAAHRDGLTRRLARFDLARCATFADPPDTLEAVLVAGQPDPARFRTALARMIEAARAGKPGARLRVFGEMVDLLWREHRTEAAIRLEELWNEARGTHTFSLLCAYVMAGFYRQDQRARFS